MFTNRPWVINSQVNAAYLLDCTPECLTDQQWFVCFTVYLNESEKTSLHSVSIKAIAFDTPNEAAELGRICGERWIAAQERN